MVDYDPEISTYDPDLFRVERVSSMTSKLGEFRLGFSRLGGPATSGWVEVPSATYNYTAEYNPDENGTLIIGSETASISFSLKEPPSIPPLYPLDKVRVTYAGEVVALWTVDTTSVTKRPTDTIRDRYDFVATLVGTYAAAMGKEICFGDLPKESPLKRISRWVKVIGYP